MHAAACTNNRMHPLAVRAFQQKIFPASALWRKGDVLIRTEKPLNANRALFDASKLLALTPPATSSGLHISFLLHISTQVAASESFATKTAFHDYSSFASLSSSPLPLRTPTPGSLPIFSVGEKQNFYFRLLILVKPNLPP